MPMNRVDFNAAAANYGDYGLNPNYRDPDSGAVLKNEIAIAQSQGDPGAEAAARRDLQRVRSMGASTDTTSTADATAAITGPSNSSSPTLQPPYVAAEARKQFSGLQALAPDVESAIFSGDKARQEASQVAGTALQASAAATAQANSLGTEADLATENLHSQLLRAVGLDVNDPNSYLSTELKRQADVRHQREDTDQQIGDLEKINFFQNPVAYLMAQPKLQALTAQYNVFAHQENSSSSEIDRLQSVADTVMKLTPAKNADLLRQKAVAESTAVVEQAKAKAAEYTAANASGHAKALMDIFTERHNLFTSNLDIQRLEEGVTDRRDRMDNAMFFKDQTRTDRLASQQQKDDEKNRDTALTIGVNAFRGAINGSNITPFKSEDIKMMPADEKRMWYDIVQRGSFGNDYQQAIPNIMRLGNIPAAAQAGNAGMMQVVRNTDVRAQQMIPEIINREKLKNPIAPSIKPQDAHIMAYNELYAKDAGSAQAGADKGAVTPDSPYAIDFDAAAALAKVKPVGIVANSLVAAKAQTGGRPLNSSFTPAMLLNAVEARVTTGEASPKDAAIELSRFMATQSTASYTTNGLKYLGLPQATDWYITPGGTGNKRVDLMDPVKLENYLTSQVAKNKAANQVGRSFMFQ